MKTLAQNNGVSIMHDANPAYETWCVSGRGPAVQYRTLAEATMVYQRRSETTQPIDQRICAECGARAATASDLCMMSDEGEGPHQFGEVALRLDGRYEVHTEQGAAER